MVDALNKRKEPVVLTPELTKKLNAFEFVSDPSRVREYDLYQMLERKTRHGLILELIALLEHGELERIDTIKLAEEVIDTCVTPVCEEKKPRKKEEIPCSEVKSVEEEGAAAPVARKLGTVVPRGVATVVYDTVMGDDPRRILLNDVCSYRLRKCSDIYSNVLLNAESESQLIIFSQKLAQFYQEASEELRGHILKRYHRKRPVTGLREESGMIVVRIYTEFAHDAGVGIFGQIAHDCKGSARSDIFKILRGWENTFLLFVNQLEKLPIEVNKFFCHKKIISEEALFLRRGTKKK